MSNFLKSPDPVCSSNGFLLPVIDYMLDEFRKDFEISNISTGNTYFKENGRELFQRILDRPENKLKMYGTAKELVENVQVYQNFSGSHIFFKTFAMNPYTTEPVIYRSLINEQYFAKPDLFVILQNMILHIIPEMEHRILQSILSIFLKSQERRVSGKLEFVRHDPKVFEKIEKEIQEMIKQELYNGFEKQKSVSLTLEKLKNLMPDAWDEEEFSRIRGIIETASKGLDERDRSNILLYIHMHSKITIEALQKIINKRPEMFLPYSEMKDKKYPITVRLFEDGSQEFVMKAELYDAMNKVSPEFNFVYTDKEYLIGTIEMEDVFQKYEDLVQNIQFIRTPIRRAKHKAVPIKCPDSGFCILAADALFQYLRNLIFGVKMFQITTKNDWKSLFKKLEILFRPDMECVYFIKLDAFEKLKKELNHGIKDIRIHLAKEVRNARKEFNVSSMMLELRRLGITTHFPDIGNHVEDVYAEILRTRKERHLTTCDFYDAIEQCQLISIVNSLPNLQTFLHFQKAWGRVFPLKCGSSIEEPEQPENPLSTKKATKKNKKKKKKAAKVDVPSKFKETIWNIYTQTEIYIPEMTHDQMVAIYDNDEGGDNSFPITSDTIFDAHPDAICCDGVQLYSSDEIYSKTMELYNQVDEKAELTLNKCDAFFGTHTIFLLDDQDVDWILENFVQLYKKVISLKYNFTKKETPFLHNLASFSRYRQRKTLYIRTFSTNAIQMEENRRVFAEDVLEVIPIILKQQGNENGGKLEEYRKKWNRNDDLFTLSLPEFREVLEDFDIDKSRITLVPDLFYTGSLKNTMISSGGPVVTVVTQKGVEVIDASQAILHIFQSIVCDIDWRNEQCDRHPMCRNQFKTIVISEMNKFFSMEEGLYVSFKHVKERIIVLRSLCHYKNQTNHVAPPLVKLLDCDFKDSITLSFFLSECESFGVKSYRRPPNVTDKQLEEAIMPVWKARLLFMLGWMVMFFEKNHQELQNMVLEAMFFRAPLETFEHVSDLMDLILGSDDKKQETVAKLLLDETMSPVNFSNREDLKYIIPDQYERWNELTSLEILREIVHSQSKEAEVSEKEAEETQRPDTLEQESKIDDVTKTSKPKPVKESIDYEETLTTSESKNTSKPTTSSQEESKTCEKCFRTSEMHKETKKELKNSQKKVQTLENKVQGITANLAEARDEIERNVEEKKMELEKKQKEIDDLKKEINDQITITNENKEMKLKISKFNAMEAQMKDTTSRLVKELSEAKKKMHKESEKKQKEIDYLKKELTTKSKLASENDELKRKILKFEAEEVKTKEESSKQALIFRDCQAESFKRISDLEKELSSAKQESEELKKEDNEKTEKIKTECEEMWSAEKQRLEGENFERMRQINQYEANFIQLIAENNANQGMIQQLLHKLNSLSINASVPLSPNMHSNQNMAQPPMVYFNPNALPDANYHQGDYIPPADNMQYYQEPVYQEPSTPSASDEVVDGVDSNWQNPE